MREIKFRAWNGKMRDVLRIEYEPFRLVMLKGDFDSKEQDYRIETLPNFESDVILMQYTGLKANGVEIYEGDIVKVKNVKGYEHIGTIKMNDGCYEIVFDNYVELHKLCKRDYLKCHTCNHAVEVIGNIHQNPELLKENP